MGLSWCKGLPNFIFQYPFSALMIARIYATITTILSLFIWKGLLEDLRGDEFYMWTAISDLLALLFLLIALWFTVQKFYWVKIDASLSLFSLLFGIISYICCWNISSVKNTHADLRYLLICHLYILVAELFILFWSIFFTWNNVSNLYIQNWGENVSESEIATLQEEF